MSEGAISSDSTRIRFSLPVRVASGVPSLASTTEFWAASYWARASRSGRSWATAIITPKTQETIASSPSPIRTSRKRSFLILGRGCPSARGRRQPSPVRNRAIRSFRAEPRSCRAARRSSRRRFRSAARSRAACLARSRGLRSGSASAESPSPLRSATAGSAGSVAGSESALVATPATSSAESFGEAPLPEVVT